MTEKRDERCCVSVSDARGFYSHQCTRKATVWIGSKGYCAQHDPEEVARRRKEQSDKWDAAWEEKTLVDALRQEQILAGKEAAKLHKEGFPLPSSLLVLAGEIIRLEKELEKMDESQKNHKQA